MKISSKKVSAMQWDITFQLSKVEDFLKDFEEEDGSRIIKLLRNTNCQHLWLVDEILNPFKVVLGINFIRYKLIPSNHKLIIKPDQQLKGCCGKNI